MAAGGIDVKEARAIAQRYLDTLEHPPAGPRALAERYLEAPHCWMFFVTPETAAQFAGGFWEGHAYAVSKSGEVSCINDFFADPVKLDEYLHAMSDYFLREECEARIGKNRE